MVGVASAPGGSRFQTDRRVTAGRPAIKIAVLALVLVGLGAVIGFSVSRELANPSGLSRGSPATGLRVAQRPAFTANEQAYIETLWPIHTDVEVAAERVALGTIFYKTNDIDRAELKSRLDQALSSYRAADDKLRQVQPPESMRSAHEGYLAAIHLFEQSSMEMLKMFDDGSDEHLQAGYPIYLDGTNRIRDVGGKFWPDEFPPN